MADLAGPISNAGFPVLLIISKNIYYHSMLDSIDRITSDQVYRRTLMNIDIINGLLDSPKGYYMSVDTNPNRRLKKGEKAGKDLTPADMPRAPKPMLEGPPKDLSFHIIPSTARIFSPVIVWPGFWRTDDIIFAENISWNFGIRFWHTNKIATGTIFLIPGNRTIKMTVTDSQGRKTTVKLNQLTCPPFADIFLGRNYRFPLLFPAYHFFERTAFNAWMSRACSATSFFSLLFSSSSSRIFFRSDNSMPVYFDRQL